MNPELMKQIDSLEAWKLRFGDQLPLAWNLRERFPDNWLRLYSLPKGKRYPTTSSDKKEILRRNNFVFKKVFGDKKMLDIIVPLEFASDQSDVRYKISDINNYDLIDNIVVYDSINSESFYIFHKHLNIGEFNINRFIEDVSSDKIMSPIFWDRSNAVYSPYDGGIDILLFDRERFRDIKACCNQWLSDHGAGL